MFPQTDSFQNSSRHQSEPLEPCGDSGVDVKGKRVDLLKNLYIKIF